jgi:hypothetical protein
VNRVIFWMLIMNSGLASLSAQAGARTAATVRFDSGVGPEMTDLQKERVRGIIHAVEREVRSLLVGLPDPLELVVVVNDRDLSTVGGVAGRAESPGAALVEISTVFPGGITAAVEGGLAKTVFHEFHHLVRGWTISDNRFGPGIPTAAVNEGLASIFSETYSGVGFERFDYPDNAKEWLAELMALPVDANYNQWMNEHPDGRIAMGYRIGRYIVHQAMERSGRSILELSTMSPDTILELAGAMDSRA